MDNATKHQLRIAKKTYHGPALELLGGMTYTQALEVLRKHGIKVSEAKVLEDTLWLELMKEEQALLSDESVRGQQ